jgi:ABC-2 type transport system permease protein
MRKETHQILRDPLSLGILLGVPTMMLLLYGYALNWDVRNVRTVVIDRDRTAESRSLVRAMTGSGYFQVIESCPPTRGRARVRARTRRGWRSSSRAAPATRSPPAGPRRAGDPRRRGREHGDHDPQLRPGDRRGLRRALVTRFALKTGRELPGIDVRARVWFNPDLRSTYFLLPGLIAFIMMLTAVVSTSLSVVREKERGTLEQLRITPMATTELLVGKTIPYLVVSLLAMTIVLIAAHVVLARKGGRSIVQLYLVTLLFLVGALSFGLLISTLVQRQQDAFQIAGLTSMLPTVLLSGFIFPIRSMPVSLQVLSHIVPARYFMRILRGIILKGAPATAYPWDLVALVIYAAVTLTLASSRLSSRRA